MKGFTGIWKVFKELKKSVFPKRALQTGCGLIPKLYVCRKSGHRTGGHAFCSGVHVRVL